MTSPESKDSFGARGTLTVGDASYEVFRLSAVEGSAALPYSLKVLLENLVRTEDGANITADHILALANWDPNAQPDTEIQFTPARVIMQDFTGVPCVVDLATMREAMADLGGDPDKINPLAPAEMVIDHSVIADVFGRADAFERNVELEYERNRERYQFLRWGQTAFDEFKVVPPGTGIVHQVNIEHLARVVMVRGGKAYPDTLVGTDSHTTMVNGLGVLGWGVGGIEAEAAMLGQPVSMLIPRVVGFKLTGELPDGTTATDLVLTITEMLRKHGVVGKFVEFYGEGVAAVPLANRATIGNMSPEFGSTAAMFPIDDETIKYLRLTGRPEEQLALVEAYAKAQGLWHDPAVEPVFSEYLELDLATVVPVDRRAEAPAGPGHPGRRQCRSFREALRAYVNEDADDVGADEGSTRASRHRTRPSPTRPRRRRRGACTSRGRRPVARPPDQADQGGDGRARVRARPRRTSPSPRSPRAPTPPTRQVMIGAALLAKKAVEKGLDRKPWVKTTLSPGSKVVMDYYERAGLLPYMEKLGFNLAGFGCMTCIGNSGPLQDEISAAVNEADLAVVSVLSGNRNFEGRINPDIKMNYLAIAAAGGRLRAGRLDGHRHHPRPAGHRRATASRCTCTTSGRRPQEIEEVVAHGDQPGDVHRATTPTCSPATSGGSRCRPRPARPSSGTRSRPTSASPRTSRACRPTPSPVIDISGARVLAKLGDSVTTDHISPAGNIKAGTARRAST